MNFQLLEKIEELMVMISQVVNMELTVEVLVLRYSALRNGVQDDASQVLVAGTQLLDRLQRPVLVEEG